MDILLYSHSLLGLITKEWARANFKHLWSTPAIGWDPLLKVLRDSRRPGKWKTILIVAKTERLAYSVASVVSDSLWPYYPWDFPGKNTGVGCHFLCQGIFPTQGWNLQPLSPALADGSFTTSTTWEAPHRGEPLSIGSQTGECLLNLLPETGQCFFYVLYSSETAKKWALITTL